MEYIVEKLIDGEWFYEGRGPLEYLNRISKFLTERGIIYRIKEVEKENESAR